MNAMKEALQRKMMGGLTIKLSVEPTDSDGSTQGSDLAPEGKPEMRMPGSKDLGAQDVTDDVPDPLDFGPMEAKPNDSLFTKAAAAYHNKKKGKK